MKKLVLLILIASPVLTAGQNKIEGFGAFKISKFTTLDLIKYAADSGLAIKKMETFEDMYQTRTKGIPNILEVSADTVDIGVKAFQSSYCPDVRVFYLPKMVIAGIEFKNVYLSFYENLLYNIHSDFEKEIYDAATLKYGEPKIETKEEQTICILKLTGLRVTHSDKSFIMKWENGDIECTMYLGAYRGDDCEEKRISYIDIGDIKTNILEDNCDRAIESVLRGRQRAKDTNKLNDF